MQGLQKLEGKTGNLILLAREAPSDRTGTSITPIRFADDLAISSDGSIYFTDASEIPPAINAAGFYDTSMAFLLAAVQAMP